MRTFGNRPRELLTNVLSAQGRIDGSLLSNDYSFLLLFCLTDSSSFFISISDLSSNFNRWIEALRSWLHLSTKIYLLAFNFVYHGNLKESGVVHFWERVPNYSLSFVGLLFYCWQNFSCEVRMGRYSNNILLCFGLKDSVRRRYF